MAHIRGTHQKPPLIWWKMSWNWECKEWPEFIYNQDGFSEQELQFFENAGTLYGGLQHVNAEEALKVDLISREAFKTSEIEGELLNRDSIHSSIRRQLGLQADHRKVEPAEQGIAEMMVDLYRNYDQVLTSGMLFGWHKMLTNGRRDLTDIGRYRTHEDPMQIVSGSINRPIVHFEAPPSGQVTKEMGRFLKWFNASQKGGKNELPVLVRAAISHLYFECIHPFEDGNGRIGRALSEMSLSQGLGRPVLIALSHTIQDNRKSYYSALESNNKDLEIDEWIHYFCDLVLKAQDYTQKTISFTIEKGKFYQRFEGQLNARQAKVIERIFREGFEGFKGGLSANNYRSITGATAATATRDLAKLVEGGAFKRTGELKSTRYYLNIRN